MNSLAAFWRCPFLPRALARAQTAFWGSCSKWLLDSAQLALHFDWLAGWELQRGALLASGQFSGGVWSPNQALASRLSKAPQLSSCLCQVLFQQHTVLSQHRHHHLLVVALRSTTIVVASTSCSIVSVNRITQTRADNQRRLCRTGLSLSGKWFGRLWCALQTWFLMPLRRQ